MTILKLSGGDLGDEVMLVRCDLSQASSPIEVDYCNNGPKEYGKHWESSQYQCADTRHTYSGLVRIAKELAASAMIVSADDFECNVEEVDSELANDDITFEVCSNTEWLRENSGLDTDWADGMEDEMADDFGEKLHKHLSLVGFQTRNPVGQRVLFHGWNGANTFTHKLGPIGTFQELTDEQLGAAWRAIENAQKEVEDDWFRSVSEIES